MAPHSGPANTASDMLSILESDGHATIQTGTEPLIFAGIAQEDVTQTYYTIVVPTGDDG